ncbi:hypothetical protein OE766_29800 [Pararhizobium sp. YC-54]|uniref:hypothetical protein n=1 Tax=Pararhizobium sp. YC-54 TaxID=2986920 RepID=UPI0021F72A01|nr:hypothetical protein [Pararhizobium sp. YC-54]MCW0002367.1 hypothetical protein [Pararhizobium sp. YC-54]
MIKSIFVAAIVAATPVVSQAADLVVDAQPIARQCADLNDASLTAGQDVVFLKKEVVARMDRAIAVAEDPHWISSTRPTFVWASETKVACGKAYGYLQSNWRDEEYIAKCDCFHAKMIGFMN